MTTIGNLRDAAELAQAVYSNLAVGPILFGQLLRTAANPSEQNMPLTQAEAFAWRFEVLCVFTGRCAMKRVEPLSRSTSAGSAVPFIFLDTLRTGRATREEPLQIKRGSAAIKHMPDFLLSRLWAT